VDCLSQGQQNLDYQMTRLVGDISAIDQNYNTMSRVNTEALKEAQDKIGREMTASADQAKHEASSVASKFTRMERNLDKLSQGHTAETEKNARNRSFCQQLSQQVNANKSNVDKSLRELALVQGVQLREEQFLQNVSSRTKQLEVDKQRLDERTTTNETAMVALNTFQENAKTKIDSHERELDRGKQRQDYIQDGLGKANNALYVVSTSLEKTTAELGTVSDRVELAHEYFDGLGEGLHDVHSRQASRSPLGPSSPAKGAALPDITSKVLQVHPPSPAHHRQPTMYEQSQYNRYAHHRGQAAEPRGQAQEDPDNWIAKDNWVGSDNWIGVAQPRTPASRLVGLPVGAAVP
jgi:chromosome segregation ATPase